MTIDNFTAADRQQFRDQYAPGLPALPSHLSAPLQNYIEDGISPGYFLELVLENNLMAISFTDDDTFAQMPQIVGYVTNYLPTVCWGSRDKVRAWMQHGGLSNETSIEDDHDDD